MDLRISRDGAVSGLSLVHASDSIFQPFLDSALKTMSFVPGTKNGAPIDQTIPARMYIRPQMKAATLETPVTDSAIVGLAADYASALAINGVITPRISKVGSYTYPNHMQASPSFLPIIVAKISLSKSGRPRMIDIVHSTFPSLDDQIRAALNWAGFDISPVSSSKPLTEFYIAVVFHPAAQYPTPKQTKPPTSPMRSTEGFLFQLLPDTLGLLVPPLPKNLQSDSLAVAEAARKYFGRVAVGVHVDSTGKIEIEQLSRAERPVVPVIRAAMKQLSFYPALRFDGRPCSFRGLVHLDFEGSTNVRIRVDWLLDRKAEPLQ